ncbi:MAG: hypothetical protein GF311_18705 [Candidatus Lokiarchaeota archaeon]|nr:hypothetical protein [Candidatus Lokiarchaeota archaeon]
MDRKLNRPNNFFDQHREYAGDEDRIEWLRTFSFDQISDLVKEFKNYSYRFYTNKRSTGFV